MKGLQLAEQVQPTERAREQLRRSESALAARQVIISDSARAWWAVLGLGHRGPVHASEGSGPPPESPFARWYAAEEVPDFLAARQSTGHPGPHWRTAEIPLDRRGRRAPGPPPVRRVPYIDRTREMKWIREHQGEFADKWVALDGDRVIAADFDAKVVFEAADAAAVARPFFVHMERKDALPFGGW